jgi:hypothetical protein
VTRNEISPSLVTQLRRGSVALTAAAALAMIVPAAPSQGESGRVVAAVEGDGLPESASTNAEILTCRELKGKLENAGSLMILSGPKGQGDTFYGPRVPQCQFWTRPVFSFVRTRDGLCGVGYICVEKFGSAGGGR